MSVHAQLDEICVTLGGTEVLRNVTLEIPRGSFVTLLGPSGSGKTTTLNVVAGFVRQSSGHVYFDAKIIDGLAVHRREIGIVFQNYALFPHMTVGENVAYALRARRVAREKRRKLVDEILEVVELPGMTNRPTRSLSGGQQQRVALARALVFKPSLLLLDEPLAALDKRLRENMQVELKRIQRDVGVTTIAVTHDQVEALTMSDFIAIMHNGEIQQYGRPEDVYRRPMTLFVAQFLGEANLFELGNGSEVGPFAVRMNASPGDTALLRPEDIDIAECGGANSAPCLARVEEVTYQGRYYRVIVRCEDRTKMQLVAFVPASSARIVEVGARVSLTCDESAIHVIPAARELERDETSPPTVDVQVSI